MSSARPTFSQLQRDPVLRMSADDVKKTLGGNLTSLTNMCCVRMSHALTAARFPITVPSDYRDRAGNKYIIRVTTMEKHLRSLLGEPARVTQESAHGRQGIILFHVAFSDASGHVDLWNESKCEYEEYWTRASSVLLWEL